MPDLLLSKLLPDPSKEPLMIGFYGSSKSGKTHLLRHILINWLKQRKFQFGIVFTPFPDAEAWDFMPRDKVHQGMNEEILTNYLRLLSRMSPPPKNFIVIDDLADSFNQKSPTFSTLVNAYRHYGITLLFTSQYPYGFKPSAREQCDFAFIWQQTTERAIKAMYGTYGMHFDNIKHFMQCLDHVTNTKYQCLVRVKGAPVSGAYMAYIAPSEIPRIKFRF